MWGKSKFLKIVNCNNKLKYGYRNPTGFRRWVKVEKSILFGRMDILPAV